MPKEEWGVKRVCPTTGKRFYDLNKNPVVSPYTGEVVELETGKNRAVTPDAEDAATKKLKTTEKEASTDTIEEEDVEVELDDDLLDDEDDGNVSLDEIADVASDNEEG
ncbi:TIGR02300 family protein [Sediminimonas sp.]|uniref:TIGR02300 family protein n=1 Tax=Sediminimonas sp. TaxID=2823379 RepID=UPI0025EB41F0|nr:TIGR02300 family protein [Sediminimonas sp.]